MGRSEVKVGVTTDKRNVGEAKRIAPPPDVQQLLRRSPCPPSTINLRQSKSIRIESARPKPPWRAVKGASNTPCERQYPRLASCSEAGSEHDFGYPRNPTHAAAARLDQTDVNAAVGCHCLSQHLRSVALFGVHDGGEGSKPTRARSKARRQSPRRERQNTHDYTVLVRCALAHRSTQATALSSFEGQRCLRGMGLWKGKV